MVTIQILMLQQPNSIYIMPTLIKAYKISFLASILFISLQLKTCAQDSNTVLKGSVKEQTYLGGGRNPSLNLRDLNNKQDAFGASPNLGMPSMGESFQPPADAFNLKASETNQVANASPPGLVNPDFGSQQAVPGLDNNQMMSAQISQNDPDNSPEMQLAWDQWHKRVAAAVYEKFNSIAQMAFKYSQPLACYATYTVTKDGRITNVQLPQKARMWLSMPWLC